MEKMRRRKKKENENVLNRKSLEIKERQTYKDDHNEKEYRI